MFNYVNDFENQVAEFYGAPYAVATDCCTHAIELCLLVSDADNITVPTQTYISIPMTLMKLNKTWRWRTEQWHDYYYLGNTNIIDGAVYWKKNGYVPGTMIALSFQFKKHLSTVKGGMILLDNQQLYERLKKMTYDGRIMNVPWADQRISEIGYHYYMTPETALQGLERLPKSINSDPKRWSYQDYPYLPDMPVFGKAGIDFALK
jgi:dTDP-4-amino-4,6-dideoxygalactose transaminase